MHTFGDFGTRGMPGTFYIFYVKVVVPMARSELIIRLPMAIYVDDNGMIGPAAKPLNLEMEALQYSCGDRRYTVVSSANGAYAWPGCCSWSSQGTDGPGRSILVFSIDSLSLSLVWGWVRATGGPGFGPRRFRDSRAEVCEAERVS